LISKTKAGYIFFNPGYISQIKLYGTEIYNASSLKQMQ
jgi:hypothetical protein